jgi:hypothetical protein
MKQKEKLNKTTEKIRKIKLSRAIFCRQLAQNSLTLSVLGALCGKKMTKFSQYCPNLLE